MATLFEQVNDVALSAFLDFTKVGFTDAYVKTAASDSDFEQSFFQLAYQQLQDKLGNLLPYLIGFEVVNKSDDGTKALGCFGFRSSNGQILFVPVFFINGSVKGLDLLYSKNHQQFYPLNEDFADMFLKDDASGLGTPSDETRDSIQRDTPNLDMRDIVRPPRTGKYTYASVKGDDSVLLNFLGASTPQIKKAFYNILTQYPDYMQEAMRIHSMDKLGEALAGMDVENPGKTYRANSDIKPVKSDEIEVIEPKNPKAKGLSPADKQTLLTQGYVIIDKRPDEKKSQFGAVKFVEKFTNPNDTGFYPYITANGGIRLGLVLTHPMQLRDHFATADSIVLDLDAENKGQAYLVDAQHVYVKDQIYIKDFGTVLKMFEDINEVKPSFDNTYILINEKLRCSTPFRVVSSLKDPSGIRRIKIELYHENNDDDPEYRLGQRMEKERRPGSARSLPKTDTYYEKPRPPCDITLVVTKQPGDHLTIHDKTVYVPAGFKVMNLNFKSPSVSMKDSEPYDEYRLRREKARDTWLAGKPGRRSALIGTMHEKNIFPLTVRANGSDFFADIPEFKKNYANPAMAKIGMVLDFGLGVKEAEELINGLEVKGKSKVSGYIKLAYTGSSRPWYQDEVPYTDEFGHPTTTGIGQEFPQPVDESYTEDPSELHAGRGTRTDPEGESSDPGSNGGGANDIGQEVQHAVQLAQGGQKEIFDTQSLATLAKYVSPSDKIQEYLPYFVSALDRLGRTLFLVHYESDKFSEAYGRTDLPQLVELLTSVFKNLGDLVIFLKRKSPELSINMSDQDTLDS